MTAIRRGSTSDWSRRSRPRSTSARSSTPGFDPGLAWVYAVVPPGGDVTRTEKLIDEEIARLAQEGPTPVEITKARNQALVGFWRGLETISGKAQALGQYEVFHGDYRKLFGAPAEYESITAEEVKNAAATVLRRENRTVGVLEPKAEPARAAGAGQGRCEVTRRSVLRALRVCLRAAAGRAGAGRRRA